MKVETADMNRRDSVTISCAPSVCAMLGVLFVGLKLTNYIDWSWWLVLLPLYGPITVTAVICIGFLLFVAIVGLLSVIFENR